MWSRKGTPVLSAPLPAPSSLSETLTSVSRVLRWTSAVRAADALPWPRACCLSALTAFSRCERRAGSAGFLDYDLLAISLSGALSAHAWSASHLIPPGPECKLPAPAFPCAVDRVRRQPQLDRPRMALETFQPGKARNRGSEFFNCTGRSLDRAGAGEEVVRAERRGKARRAGGRQDVIGSRQVIAERRGTQLAYEHRARRAHASCPSRGIANIQLEMLGG